MAVFGTTGLVVALSASLAVVGLAPVPSAAVSAQTALDFTSETAEIAVPPFGITAVQADGYGLLTGSNLDSTVPIASMAKVVTALVVLEAHPIPNGTAGDPIVFDAQDVAWFNESVANAESRADVIEGMELSQRDVITVMLVKSANNYSRTLARWAFGSDEAFVTAANDWAARNGLSKTTIADSSGLNPQTQSSLNDLLVLGRMALDNPVTAQAVASPVVAIDPIGEIENSNKLLGTLGVNGIKTGTTDEAGACLLFSANLPVGDASIRIIGVTVGAPDHDSLDAALSSMLESIQAGFHVVTPTTSGQVLATATTAWNSAVPLVSAETVSRIVWSSTPVTVSLPATVGGVGGINSSASAVTVQFGDEVVVVEMLRSISMDDPGLAWRVTHVGELF